MLECDDLDRYLRLRRGHRLAATPALWLGDRGRAFGYDGLHKTLAQRASAAGIPCRMVPSGMAAVAGAGAAFAVTVPAERADEARELLGN